MTAKRSRTAKLNRDIKKGRFGRPLAAALILANELERELRRWEENYAGWCVGMMACGVTSFGTLDDAFKELQKRLSQSAAWGKGAINDNRSG